MLSLHSARFLEVSGLSQESEFRISLVREAEEAMLVMMLSLLSVSTEP